MGLRNIAEAVILQSLEDLSSPVYRRESREFFEGEGFKVCSEILELDSLKKYKIINFTGGRKHGRTTGVHRA